MVILEIEAEGLPRYVGPFLSEAYAEGWARDHIRNGSWSLIYPVHPADVG